MTNLRRTRPSGGRLRSRRLVAAAGVSALLCLGTGPQSKTPPATVPQRAGRAIPAGTGRIGGTVVAGDTGHPVRRAAVRLVADPGLSRSTLTDNNGAFSFANLPPGRYTLMASKPGFLDVTYGQREPGTGRPGTPIDLADGQQLDRIALTIPRGGVVTGTVTDEAGEPAFGIQVRAMRYVMRSGERTLQAAGTASTDDRGIYRIPVLPPGDYIVSAEPRESAAAAGRGMAMAQAQAEMAAVRSVAGSPATEQAMARLKQMLAGSGGSAADTGDTYAPVYYPGTTRPASAVTMTVGVAEVRAGIDLQLQLVPTARVSGTVIAAGGAPAGGLQSTTVMLVDTEQPLPGLGIRVARLEPNGRFTFTGVPPGQYALNARAMSASFQEAVSAASSPTTTMADMKAKLTMALRNAVELWAASDVTVNGEDVANLTLTLQQGLPVSGTVAFDGASSQPVDPTRIHLNLLPTGPNATVTPIRLATNAAVDAQGRFAFAGVAPGRYRVVAGGTPAGWTLTSAVFGGRDALDFLLEVKPGEAPPPGVLTFSTRTAGLDGTLTDVMGRPTADYTIVLFAADARYWLPQARRIRATRPATDGRFRFTGLPAGDYRLVALTDVEPGQWYDPAFLKSVAGLSIPLRLADGEHKTQDLRVGR